MRNGHAAYSDGVDACTLMDAFGFQADGWQEDIINDWCARDEDDTPSYLSMGLSVPRQNGKNGCIEIYEFYKMIVCKERILHTAHQVKTANKSFQRLCAYFTDDEHPEIRAMVKSIRRTNGEQGIYLTNGALIEYSARSRGASRGNTYSVVIFDEAQELTDEQTEALMPTLAASPTGYRQLIYTGTPPGPGSPGTVFGRLRSRCLSDQSPKKSCWHEWSVDSLPIESATFSDVKDSVFDTNPAMGIRLDLDFTENEFASMSLDGFARERLGWWASTEERVDRVINAGTWEACEIAPDEALSPEDGTVCYGVKFDAKGWMCAISVAVNPQQGPAYVELVDVLDANQASTYLADRLAQNWRKVAEIAVDGKAGAAAMVQRLQDNGVPGRRIRVCNPGSVIAASSMFVDAVASKTLAHIKSDALDDSVTKSIRRKIGSNGGFGFGDSADAMSCPAESAALALWAAKTTKINPARKQVVRC